MRRLAVLLSLTILASPAQANWGEQFLDDAAALAAAPTVSLSHLFVETDKGLVPVSKIILAPVHTGQTMGPGLQLPDSITPNKLVRGAKPLAKYELNGDGVLDKAELTRGLLAFAVASKTGGEFGVAKFYQGADVTSAVSVDRFLLNYDDASYLRRVLTQHGRVGALDMLEVLATDSNAN